MIRRSLVALVALGSLVALRTSIAEPLDPVEMYTLANGMTVVLAPDPGVASVVVHTRYEVADPRAAIVERLMFHGSRHVADGAFESAIERAGGWVNASTTTDHASCVTHVPAGALALALHLEAERMTGLTIDARRVAAARAEIVVGPLDVALGGVAPDGDELAAFWRAHYGPASTTLVIAGRFDPRATRALIERELGAIPRTTTIPTQTASITPLDHAVALTAPGSLPKLSVAFRAPAPSTRASRALDVLAYLLAGKRGRLASVAPDVRVDHLDGRFTIELGIAEGDPVRVRAAVAAQLAALADVPVPEDELARAHAMLDARFVESLETLALRAETLARWAHLGDVHRFAIERRERHVSADELREAARIWLADSAAVTLVTTP
ncbi:MAG: insulinase family protein [Proteobacteria bacterium]|nr:insulinase family protein [Pseudomonadota bacterium]